MNVSPHTSHSPSDVTVRVRVPRHADNRLLIVAAFDGELETQRSEAQIDGEQSRQLYVFTWLAVGAGDYEVVAVLIGSSGKPRARAQQAVRLINSMEGP